METLWDLVASIPKGKCVSYGALGRALPNPASGYFVGRWMAGCPAHLPWHRVVAKDGRLPVHKRDPRMADEQMRRLKDEGVAFRGDAVDMDACGWEP